MPPPSPSPSAPASHHLRLWWRRRGRAGAVGATFAVALLAAALLLALSSYASVVFPASGGRRGPALVGLTLVRRASEKGALCLDGSAPGYHLQRGSGSGSQSWLIHLEGGGWCRNLKSCASRQRSMLGSSRYMEGQVEFTGILSDDESQNPAPRQHENLLCPCDPESAAREQTKHASMRPYIPKSTFAFCHGLLASRLLPSAASPAAPLLSVQALLVTAGLLPRHPDLALLALNSLLHALSRRAACPAHPRLALRLVRLMHSRTTPPALPAPDHLSFPFALSAAAALDAAPDPSSSGAGPGPQLHALLVRNALFPADHYVTTALLQLYSPRPDLARRVFDELPRREAIHYDLLIGSYARAGAPAEGLAVFRAMFDEDGVAPDAVVLTTAVAACAQAGALDHGAWVHRYVERAAPWLLADAFLGSALVGMYAKCGCLDEAVRVFDGMPKRNAYVWGTMVGALAVHGKAAEAVACLDRMAREDGVRPDGVAVLGALSACAHAGNVEEGLRLLREMRPRYGVVAGHEHYSCAVDMLCRVGRLEDAVGLVETMPMTPLASVWGSVLAGCRSYGNVELAEVAVRELEKLGGTADEGVYVQLSNIYLDANRKDDARRVRKLIGSRGIKKVPAYSAVEVDGEVSSFVADDQAHPRRFEIWEVLRLLADQMTQKPKEEEFVEFVCVLARM